MAMLTDREQALLDGGSYAVALKVEVLAADGVTWHDLTRMNAIDSESGYAVETLVKGIDLVNSATVSADIDSPHTTLDLRLKREVEGFSIAPLMVDSAFNRDYDQANPYSALLRVGATVRVYAAITSADIDRPGQAPATQEWGNPIFQGRIDSIDPGSGEEAIVECRDHLGVIADVAIEEEKVYAYAPSLANLPTPGLPFDDTIYGIRVWQANTEYAEDDLVIHPTADVGYVFKADNAGTSAAATAPAFTNKAITYTDNTITWSYAGDAPSLSVSRVGNVAAEKVINSLLCDAWRTLEKATPYDFKVSTPVSPSWNIKQWKQRAGGTYLEAMREIATQIGWTVRYKPSNNTVEFSVPDRAKTTPDATFYPSDYFTIGGLKISLENVRNVVRIGYYDSAQLHPNGDPVLKFVTVEDATSAAKYGRRFMQIPEEANSLIDSSTEATIFAQAALAELKEPTFELEAEHPYLPGILPGLLFRYKANDRHFSTDQDLAVASYRHTFEAGKARTTVMTQGRPAALWKYWRQLAAEPGTARPPQITLIATNVIIITLPIVGGLKVKGTTDKNGKDSRKVTRWEWHVSKTPGFTLSSSTLKATSANDEAEIQDLDPGVTYYVKGVPIIVRDDGREFRGYASEEETIVAGRAAPRYLEPETRVGLLPLNGDFSYETDAGIPDHWEAGEGAGDGDWGADLYTTTSTSRSGSKSLEFRDTAQQLSVLSHHVVVEPSKSYDVEAWLEPIVSNPGDLVELRVLWYTGAKTFISTSTVSVDTDDLDAGYNQLTDTFVSPSTAKFARVNVRKGGADGTSFRVGAVTLRETPAAGGGGTAVGGVGEVQYSDGAGGFDASSQFYWSAGASTLVVDGLITATGKVSANDFEAATGTFAAGGTSTASLKGKAATGAGAVGVVLDNTTNLTTAGAKILSIRNATVEKASVDKDGYVFGKGFHQTTAASQGISWSGNDTYLRSGTSADIHVGDPTGSVYARFSGMADGASAVAVILSSKPTYSTAGAKLLSVRNNGTEKFSIELNGARVSTSIASSTHSQANAAINIENSNTGAGHNQIVHSFGGTVKATSRVDFVGNMNEHCNTGAYHQWYDGQGTGTPLANLSASGLAVGGGAGTAATAKLDITGTAKISSTLAVTGLITATAGQASPNAGAGVLTFGNVSTPNTASTTTYLRPVMDNNVSDGNELFFPVPIAGVLRGFYIRTFNPVVGGNQVYTVRKNGVDTAMVVTMSPGVGNVNGSYTATTVSVAAGDLISVKLANGVGVSSGAAQPRAMIGLVTA